MQADLPKRLDAGILPQPITCRRGGLGRVADYAPVGLLEVLICVRKLVPLRIRVGYPTPATFRFHGHAPALIMLREGLQPGVVGAESESAVPHSQWGINIELANHRVVSGNQRLPVNPGGSVGS